MAEQLSLTLAAEFPEYTEFSYLLNVSEITWKRYGLSAEALAEMDSWKFEMLLIKLGL